MKSETEAVLNEKDQVGSALSKLEDQMRTLTAQLSVEEAQGEYGMGKLVLKLLAKEAKTTTVAASYVSTSAGWAPVYDVIADHPGQPVRLIYKANIHQDCGINWDNVKLTLSTGNPSEGMQPPSVDPWHISFVQAMTLSAASSGTYNWSANAVPAVTLTYATTDSVAVEDPVTAEAVIKKSESLNTHVEVDNGGVNTSFDIDLPYSIPNDNKEHLVAVKHFDVPATYIYSAFPKADDDAFLLARIANWHELNLLEGKTNIFYEGAYVGQGSIDPANTGDTLDISLGRDKKIVITREQDKARRSVRTIGSNVRQTYAYTITLRNNRKEAAQMLLTEQLPISDDKDITIEDTELSGGVQDEKTGAVKWNFALQPNETKTLKFGFTLKYPKGKVVAGMP